MLLSSFSVVHLLMGMQPVPKNSTVRLPQRTNFHLQLATNWKQLLGYGQGPATPFGSRTRSLGSLADRCRPCVCCLSPCEFTWPCCIQKSVFPQCLVSPLAFLLFAHLLFCRAPQGDDLLVTCHLVLSVPGYLILGIMSGSGSPCLSSLLQEEASLMVAEQGPDM